MMAAEGLHDICCEFIPCDTDRLIADDTGQGYDRDPCRTTANIDDHITNGLFHVNSDTHSGCHWFMDQVYFFCAALHGPIPPAPFFSSYLHASHPDHHTL